jgi:hypothetical protein
VKQILLALMVGAVLLSSSCAGFRAHQARQKYLDKAMQQASIRAYPDQVLSSAKLVLAQEGFASHEVSQGVIETDWKTSASYGTSSSSSTSWKYVVTAVPVAEGGTRLVVMKSGQSTSTGQSGSTSEPTTTRDHVMELNIMRNVDPALASQLENEAESRAQAAANTK